MEIKELKEKYNELCEQRSSLRKEAVKAVCNKVASILAGTESKKLDYNSWANEACDITCGATVFFNYGCDQGGVVAVQPDGTKSFSIDVSGEDTYTIQEDDLSVDQIMDLITDLEALEEYLSGEASDGKIEWKINEEGVVEYIGD